MNIVLVAVNSRYSHSNPALFTFKKILSKKYKTTLLELTTNEEKSNNLYNIISCSNKEITHILFSIYIWNKTIVEELIDAVSKLMPNTKIIIGGPEVTYNIEYWKSSCCADYIIKGAGEGVLTTIISGEIDDRIVNEISVDIDSIPFAYESEDLEILNKRLLYYETSKGCPYSCSYCLSACEDQKLQFRSIDLVKKEIAILAKSSVKVVKLVDRSFNCKPNRARDIWEYILELDSGVSFHFEIHPLLLQEEDFDLLARVPKGLFHFEVGVQSVLDSELDAVKRIGKWKDIKSKIDRLIQETSIDIHLDQIVGLPTATVNSTIESFNQILSLAPEEFQMGFLKIIPGTPLEKEFAEKYYYWKSPPYEIIATPEINYEELSTFHRIEQLVNSFYNSGKFNYTIKLLLFSDFYDFRKDPFSLFMLLKPGFDSYERIKPLQWTKLAEVLLERISEKFKDKTDYLLDSLRRDWAVIAQGNYFPDFLKYKDNSNIKKYKTTLKPLVLKMGYSKAEFNRSVLVELLCNGKENIELHIQQNGDKNTILFCSVDIS